MMRVFNATSFQALLFLAAGCAVNGLSSTAPEAASRNRSILQQSLASIANKLTLSPEIIIPEPTDPTALLLQSTEVTKMSNAIRSKAKGNAAFISGSVNSLKLFCREQETARGNFPGPIPVIYCKSSIEENVDIAEIAEAGAAGYLYTAMDGEEIGSADALKKDDTVKGYFDSAVENGMQLIPEIVLKPDQEWNEEAVTGIINAINELCGAEPAAILLTVGAIAADDDDDDGESSSKDEEENEETRLPQIPRDLAKRIPILGSVRAAAGYGRMGIAVGSLKEAGFKGCVLRCDCLPGYRMNPDLEFVGGFWGAAISDLKSTKSKNFSFRSTIALDRDIPMEWYNYQKDVMESGALGSPEGGGADPLDADNGDYQGF